MNGHVEDRRLNDFVDRILPHGEKAEVETHLESCDTCRSRVQGLASLVDELAGLPSEAEPARNLWSGIEARIDGGVADVLELPVGRHAASRRVSATWGQLLAAGIALATVSGGTVWMAVGGRDDAPAVAGGAPALVSAIPAVQVATTRYEEAISQLESLLEEGRDMLAPETLATLERSLSAIESAISEARTALLEDPDSELLDRLLINHHQVKLRVLERATAALQL